MLRIKPSNNSEPYVTYHTPRDSGQGLPNNEDTNKLDPVLQQGQGIRIMAEGANPNATCRLEHASACHIAAMFDNDALDLLLTSGADSSRSGHHVRTPLHLAAWTGNVKQIALLLNFPEALRKSVVDHDVLSPEIVEEVKRHSVPVNKLTNEPFHRNVESTLPGERSDGVEHNCRDIKNILPVLQEGWTPLHAASARAQHRCVQLLLAASADPTAQDVSFRTPLDVVGCAHYMEHSIDVNNFMETIDLLLKAGGQFLKYGDDQKSLDTPLHTAVELESEAAVEQLLQAGASAVLWNSRGLTAMHVCVEKRNNELLQLLAHHKCRNEDPSLVTVDVKDRTGFNVLCAAVKAEWIQGVCIALDAGASITMKANGECPMHIAAQLGNIVILQKILDIAQEMNFYYCNEERATALFKATCQNHQDALELLLKNGFSIDTVNSDRANVFHIATKYGRNEILEYLLRYDCNITRELINMPDRVGPPLYYAIENNHTDCAVLLISKGAQVNVNCVPENSSSTTLLHIAARKNYCEIAEMIIKHDSETVHMTPNVSGWTPLHEACHNGNREMIVLLLHKGADLSGVRNAQTDTPIELLMNHVSKPTEFIEEVFDSCISSQDESLPKCPITNLSINIDYSVLYPPCKVDRREERIYTKVIQALLDTGNTYDQHRLLLHPLVESFLYLEWRSLLPIFYPLLFLHSIFAISLNIFVVSVFWDKDGKIEPVPYSVWIYIMFIVMVILIIWEDVKYTVNNGIGIRNLWCLETWFRFLSITLIIILLPYLIVPRDAEWVRLFSAASLFFTWIKIIFLLSRLPEFGYYVLMYEKVVIRVITILVPLGFIIIGFSVSFMIQFHAQPPFEGFWSSLLMTMVMMASEPGYKDTFNKDHKSASLIMLRITFAAFLFLVSIVLMNMLVGVAVNDIKDLEVIGNIKKLEKQVEFIAAFKNNTLRHFKEKINIFKICLDNREGQKDVEIRSQCYDRYTHSRRYHLPARLREAIFEKAQSQKEQSDKKQDTMLYNMKLDEMHKVIVKNFNGEPTTTQRLVSLETAVNNIFEEIYKLRKRKCGRRSAKKRRR